MSVFKESRSCTATEPISMRRVLSFLSFIASLVFATLGIMKYEPMDSFFANLGIFIPSLSFLFMSILMLFFTTLTDIKDITSIIAKNKDSSGN